ncbi:MAG: phage portal protein [Acidobacteria bacterium]|nr:phage portal protein [Acidobacteriota bacterium]
MAEQKDIETAITRFKESCGAYEKSDRYYRGDHDLKFATEKFKNVFGPLFREFALNLCPAVVDALRDKLILTEFGVEDGGDTGLPEAAWKIWQANRMGKRSGEVHKEAVKNGDSYVIVWPNPAGEVTIYPNRAATCTVIYDEETPGKVLWAAKHWRAADKRFRLNLYYTDRIEKYISKKTPGDRIEATASFYDKNFTGGNTAAAANVLPDAKDFVPIDDDIPVVRNPYGVVPVFHFANNSDIGMHGQSELSGAVPIQDALNKSVLDMLVAMEFASYRQRWASGIEIEYNDDGDPIPPFTAGIEKLWTTENPEAKFGDFEAANLEQFLKVKDGFRTDMACVTGTPIWYFMQAKGDFPSGEALRKSETRFTNKVRDRQQSFGQVWEDVMAFALMIENKGKGVRLFAGWEDPSPLSEKEELENLMIKKDLGISDEQALMEAGYGDEDVKRMMAANLAKRDAMVDSFNAGEDG